MRAADKKIGRSTGIEHSFTWAWCHRARCRARGSRAPSRRCRPGSRPGRCGCWWSLSSCLLPFLPCSSRRGFSFLGQGGAPSNLSLFLSLLFPKCVRSGDKKGSGGGGERERGAGGFLGALGRRGNWKRLLLQQPTLLRGRCSREPAGPLPSPRAVY